ncbi:MAG: hypothetical protein JEZ04_13825 [Spirochaetales bacterium]|nr:hypothetical protein [Spirochaetales bacterium]
MTFDGASYYSSDDASFYAPLWQDAPGFYVNAGFGFGSENTGFELCNSVSYSLAFHEGSHLGKTFYGNFNEVMFSASLRFFEIADFIQPYITGGMSWSWLNVDNGVILSGGSPPAASYPGLGINVGAGTFLELFDFFLIDITAGYRILDYLSGTYEGFSRHFGGDGSGWYVKIGTNFILYRE